MNQLYGYPAFPQGGLGNLLSVWADCLLWCKDNNARMIHPSWWLKFHIGPYLRRERDKRYYQRYFVSAGHINGLHKCALLIFAQQVSAEDWRAGEKIHNQTRNTVVRFSDMTQFSRLIGRHTEVASALYRITRPEFYPFGIGDTPFVGIHVRFGDYPPFPEGQDSQTIYFRLPIDWYIDCLQEVRRGLNMEIMAIIFSDGTDDELAPLLNLSNVIRSPFNAAITDMMALSQASMIITSRSTFSIWGAYLGQVPSVWYPKKIDICGKGVLDKMEAENQEIEWMQGMQIPTDYIQVVSNRIKHSALGGKWENKNG